LTSGFKSLILGCHDRDLPTYQVVLSLPWLLGWRWKEEEEEEEENEE
jgi:hypothetical protein